ncbi:MAG: tRNA (adenosine(37)-N6)-threonylcarbamoyltransferase complex dimerization subunit type 1 TsaB [Gammaproteobacteria bacterium]|nr:tRNA (adenosine(37)-N6)-threonylcarbamoyltransferase complex dimerization subunit type 1 TsaB [Gammaproteobacteria bacterium]
MRILALDTATEMCSVALQCDGRLYYREQTAPKSHSELILPMVDHVLHEAGLGITMLDAVVVDRGPGSFTGLRIGVGVAQGLAFGANLPLLAVSSLAALAQAAYTTTQSEHVLACIDARMKEVYWACFSLRAGLPHAVTEEYVTPASAVYTPDNQRCYGIGTGFSAYPEELNHNPLIRLTGYAGERYPLARHLIPLAQAQWNAGVRTVPEVIAPVYVRNNVATQK